MGICPPRHAHLWEAGESDVIGANYDQRLFWIKSVPVLYTPCRAARLAHGKQCRQVVGIRYLLQRAGLLRLPSLQSAVLRTALVRRFESSLSSKALQLLMIVQRLA